MPIYEYRCRKCEHEFERLVRTSRDERAVKCPACETGQVERKLSVFSAQQGTPGGSALPPSCAQCPGANGSCPRQA